MRLNKNLWIVIVCIFTFEQSAFGLQAQQSSVSTGTKNPPNFNEVIAAGLSNVTVGQLVQLIKNDLNKEDKSWWDDEMKVNEKNFNVKMPETKFADNRYRVSFFKDQPAVEIEINKEIIRIGGTAYPNKATTSYRDKYNYLKKVFEKHFSQKAQRASLLRFAINKAQAQEKVEHYNAMAALFNASVMVAGTVVMGLAFEAAVTGAGALMGVAVGTAAVVGLPVTAVIAIIGIVAMAAMFSGLLGTVDQLQLAIDDSRSGPTVSYNDKKKGRISFAVADMLRERKAPQAMVDMVQKTKMSAFQLAELKKTVVNLSNKAGSLVPGAVQPSGAL